MLGEELSLRVSTLLKGLIRRREQKKKKTLQYTSKIILVFQSRTHSKTAQQNTVKVLAAQFRTAYCLI